jgi:primase-polymerase (primpol)-like protein
VEEALRQCARAGHHGIGFVFSAGDPFCGVDLDHCRDVDTGALEPWAAAIVHALDSYAEASPSGAGVHVIVRATLPPGRRRRGPLEMYDRQRYFTLTGRHIAGTPADVQERQTAIEALHARLIADHSPPCAEGSSRPALLLHPSDTPQSDLRARAARGRIRPSTLALLDSTGPAGYQSPSEADAALAAGLASAGLTAAEALSLFLDSARGADALRRKGMKYGESYLRRTVAHACNYVGPVVERPNGLRVRYVAPRPVQVRYVAGPRTGEVVTR